MSIRRFAGMALLLAGLVVAALPSAPAAAEIGVRLETSMGDITLRLDERNAPMTVGNFVEYVRAGFYDGLIFHRVIPNFMIQGGGLTPEMKEKKGRAPIKNEGGNGLKNVKYSIAMARTSEPHSASSQFFINVKDNDFLDHKGPHVWGYAVFGKVIRGQDVVDRIARVATEKKGHYDDVPVEPVIIRKATITQ